MQHSPRRIVLSLGLIAALGVACSKPASPEASKTSSSLSSINEKKPAMDGGKRSTPVATTVDHDEGDNCSPAKSGNAYGRSECKEGLICTPSSEDPSKGSCRVSCGESIGGRLKKHPELCESDRSCQNVTSLAFDEYGAFCMPQQQKRDGKCSALHDDQACSDGRLCAASDVLKDDAGNPYAVSFVCRDACPFGVVDASSHCKSEEKCVAYPYDSSSQKNSEGAPIVCTETKCTGDTKDCECDVAAGFQCSPLIPGVLAFCERKAGMCVTPVPFAQASDFESPDFEGTLCNEVKGHAFCDNSLFEGLDKGGQALCMQISEQSGDGFCFAFCSTPALDADGDGQLNEKEAGQKFSCPKDYSCKRDLGRKLGMVASIPDGAGGRKPCDPAKCEKGKACPSECGIGEAECLSYPMKNQTTQSFCGAPYGNCERDTSVSH